MSSATLVLHHHSELAFVGADTTLNIVHFTAPSKSTKGKVNTVSLDTVTGAIHCDCTAAMVGTSTCWHHDWVSAAWANHEARRLARAFTFQQLITAGKKARHMVDFYTARIWRCIPADAAMLIATRCEYRERAALAAAPADEVAA